MPIQAQESKFKGNPILVLTWGPDDKYPMKMGLSKAKKALAAHDLLKEFVHKHKDRPRNAPPAQRTEQRQDGSRDAVYRDSGGSYSR